jgi:hypothetical protein
MSNLTLPPNTNASQAQSRSFLSIQSENAKISALANKPPLTYPVVNGESIVIRKFCASIEVSPGRTETPTYLTDVETWTYRGGDLHFLDSKFFFHPAGTNGPAFPITKVPSCLYTDENGQTTLYSGSNQTDMPSSVPSQQ